MFNVATSQLNVTTLARIVKWDYQLNNVATSDQISLEVMFNGPMSRHRHDTVETSMALFRVAIKTTLR